MARYMHKILAVHASHLHAQMSAADGNNNDQKQAHDVPQIIETKHT